MSKKEIVYEIFWLRAISCVAIVLIHSISQSLIYGDSVLIEAIQMIGMFGTPAFIFISEFLIAKTYSETIPKGFLKKRAKVLLSPFVLMGLIYAFVSSGFSMETFIMEAVMNVFFADYVAYFIIIIFQFYILHVLLHNYLNRWNPIIVLSVSFVINILYLSFFHFVGPLNVPHADFIWKRLHWYPFVGWIFYFTLGYYCGRNNSQFKQFLQNHQKWIFLYIVGSTSILLLLWYNDFLSNKISSKRVDVLFFTVGIIFLLFYLTQNVKKVPRIVMFISRYSFSIYLLHKLFMGFIPPIIDNVYIYTAFIFICSIALSVFISFLLNKTSFGKYLVGRIVSPPNSKSIEIQRKAV